ncbi:MAG: dTDP-4-dehydrorhamnose reductase [Tidjanibacter sp.]|nr:dTDP-4-dehydrorhamnose reductase [Tidjanibacter sp.]
MRVLVTGGNGQLGCSLRRVAMGSEDKYIFTDVAELDITNREAVATYIADNRIDIIINCAAYTDVECAEEEEAKALLLNATAASYLADAAKANNALLIHISTDYVFMGGCCGVLTEESYPQPINAYGRTKLAGEEAVEASGCHYIIVRTAWLYSEYGKNFVRTMLRLTAEKEAIHVVDDQLGTPTYAGDLAEALVRIISERNFREGLYHYTNLGECSWWQFAKEIARLAGHERCAIKPCTTAEYPTKARRPQSAVLDKSKFIRTFNIAIPEWQNSLDICINNINHYG